MTHSGLIRPRHFRRQKSRWTASIRRAVEIGGAARVRYRDGLVGEQARPFATRFSELPGNGLRRSFATLSEWVEAPTEVVAQIMGHKPSAIAEKHYLRRSLDLLRMWHDKIETWVLEQAGIRFVAEESKPIALVSS